MEGYSIFESLKRKINDYVRTLDIGTYSKDPITGLLTHKDFHNIIRQRISEKEPFSLLITDIDNFKGYNVHKGYSQGDELLKDVATIICQHTREGDYVCRYGGDEFAIILPDTTKEIATAIAFRLKEKLISFLSKAMLGLSVSIGVANYPSDSNNSEEILRYARLAQHLSKTGEKKGVSTFTSIIDLLDSDFQASEDATFSTIRTLINIINIKDKYTYGHSQRVAKYSYMLGKEHKLSTVKLNDLQIAAYLHDIGKIAVDEEILCKPGRLTEEEFAKMKKHPEFAAEIIKPISSLKQLVPGILQHHERYDGKGYPYGLKANDISIEGKIIQVADSFDAMTSLRPYQKQKNFLEAWHEIQRCSGTQFDPEVVEAFSKLMARLVEVSKNRRSVYAKTRKNGNKDK